MITRAITSVGLLVLALFALQNMEVVSVQFLLWTYETSLVVIVGPAALGACLAAIVSLGPRLRRAREIDRLAKTVHAQAERIRRLEAQERSTDRLPPGLVTDNVKGEHRP